MWKQEPASKERAEQPWPPDGAFNISPAERVGRIGVGLFGVVVGLMLLAGATSTVSVLLEILLLLAGLDLVVTGATGHCPLYQRLGHVPRALHHER